jgi:hypothetical protein
MNPLDHPVIFSPPRRRVQSAWTEHIPFAMYLMSAQRPETLVELGTHKGNSYCAFCQAVDELLLDTNCHAVDTWAGDAHTGSYGTDVLHDLQAHHDPLYARFSTLMRATFEEARVHFSDGSIDLIHLDGYHTYEAVKHDYESWLPKLRDGGVFLLHDIHERRGDFGVWKLWEEAKREHRSFEFFHGHGLGLLAVGEAATPELDALLDAPAEVVQPIRQLFFHLGTELRLQFQAEQTTANAKAKITLTQKNLKRERENLKREREKRRDAREQLAQVRRQRDRLGKRLEALERSFGWRAQRTVSRLARGVTARGGRLLKGSPVVRVGRSP